MSPQAPPYTDTPPAYSEVNVAFESHSTIQVTLTLTTRNNLKPVSASADIPAQICASTSGAWSGASDVIPLPWCSGVHAHAASYACWAGGPECPHGLLPHGSCVPAWLNSDSGWRLWCWSSLLGRQQRFHSSECPPRSQVWCSLSCCVVLSGFCLCVFLSSLAPTSWTSPQCRSAGCHAGCQCCNDTA